MKYKVLITILIILTSVNSNNLFSSSNSKYKYLTRTTQIRASPFPIIIRMGNEHFFLVNKSYDGIDISNYVIYNYVTNSFKYIDSSIFSQLLSKQTLLFFNGLINDGKLILSGVEDKKICLYYNPNGVWGKWDRLYLLKDDSLEFGYSHILVDPNYKNMLYLLAQDTKKKIHFFKSNDNGSTWYHYDGLSFGKDYIFDMNSFIAISTDIIYAVSKHSFYKINLNTKNIDSVKILTQKQIDSNQLICNVYFANENDGIIEVKTVAFIEGITKYQRSLFYVTNNGGKNWNNISELRFWPSSLFFLEVRPDYILMTNDWADIIESYDFGKSWIIEKTDRQQDQETYPFWIIKTHPISHRKYLIYDVFNQLWELDLDAVNINSNDRISMLPFPNPARTTTWIKLQHDGEVTISAVDILGRSFQLWSGYTFAGDKELDVSSLPAGTYNLLINYGTKIESVRMIKE